MGGHSDDTSLRQRGMRTSLADDPGFEDGVASGSLAGAGRAPPSDWGREALGSSTERLLLADPTPTREAWALRILTPRAPFWIVLRKSGRCSLMSAFRIVCDSEATAKCQHRWHLAARSVGCPGNRRWELNDFIFGCFTS